MFFGGLTIAINGFSMGFFFATIAFNDFRWFWTIGQRCDGFDGSSWSSRGIRQIITKTTPRNWQVVPKEYDTLGPLGGQVAISPIAALHSSLPVNNLSDQDHTSVALTLQSLKATTIDSRMGIHQPRAPSLITSSRVSVYSQVHMTRQNM